MPDTIIAWVHSTDESYSWGQSKTELIHWDAAHDQRIMGWSGQRCGTDGIEGSRNRVARDFLQSPAEWLFWTDTDMGFAPDSLDRLLAVAHPTDRPIVGGLCFGNRELHPDNMGGWVTAPIPTIYDHAKDDQDEHGFVPRRNYPRNSVVACSATGSAFVVIHRSVFEKISDQHGPGWYNRIRTTPDTLERGGTVIAEDLSFCMRAAAAGCPTFVHTGVKTTHHKPVWLGEDRYLQETWPDPATDPVAVVVPVLNRPDRPGPFMQSLRSSTGLATAYFVCDPDDTDEIAAVEAAGGTVLIHDRPHGTFAAKANYGYEHTTEPWILLVGDDVWFRPGWYDRAIRAAGDRFHLVGTNDLSAIHRPQHAVHPLIRRSWVDQHGASLDGPGVIAHEGYRHNFVDNEWSLVASRAGVLVQAPDSVVEHMHPLFKKATDDTTYQKGRFSYERDRRLWEKRAQLTPKGFSIQVSVAAYERQWHTIPGLVKVQEDLDRYTEIIEATQPEVIVECGTWTGKSAEWFANHGPDVITIDVEDNTSDQHPKVTYLLGSSTDPEVVQKVTGLVNGRRCMVVLDSDHSGVNVAAELLAYSPLVSPGCYLVVEDGICRFVPGTPCTDLGPLDAIEQFLPRPGWEHDDDLLNRYPVSHHPGGWLRRAG